LSAGRCHFAGFSRLIGIDRRKLPIGLGELSIQFLLLFEDFVAFAMQTFTFPVHHIRKPNIAHLAPLGDVWV
jgi:hypothetical protein